MAVANLPLNIKTSIVIGSLNVYVVKLTNEN